MTQPNPPQLFEQNPWLARSRKVLVSGAIALVELANVWADGPPWLYAGAAIAGTFLLYWVPNAPKYRDPRQSR